MFVPFQLQVSENPSFKVHPVPMFRSINTTMDDQTKLCRVCLGEGARYIFHSSLVNDEQCSVASINFIADKLRFVLLLPINEHDGLAMWICDLCLVQLNVAYQFKRLALESDQKLRHFEASHQEPCVEISNAITYHSDFPDSCLDIGPTVKHETEASPYSGDHSDVMVLPKIASVESCSMEEFVADSISVSPKSCKDKQKESTGMVTLNIDPTNPEEDKAFIQSIIQTPFLISVAKSSPRTDLLCGNKARDTGKRSPLTATSTKGKPKKATSKRQENKPANHQEPPSIDETDLTSLQSDGKVNKTPPSKTNKKMASLMKSLTINMVAQKTPLTPNYVECPTIEDQDDMPIAKKVKLRRNSVCASNYYQSRW
ncbi:uncharacterized protein LOC131263315 isoform X2 [Anopheles coustani]|uniref:uncharacterized protein LOC131263315 isoform X2 n=1 Tax=Anopheles coustani TaxID=139045 RepID=UPI00265A1A6A|nr:uncharacterized protein LOC131263315 isoform X2 [Anopheles coustani]